MVERLKVNQFHTTPSAIRRLMRSGNKYVEKYDLSSLKTIGSGVCIALVDKRTFKKLVYIQALAWFTIFFTPMLLLLLLYGL